MKKLTLLLLIISHLAHANTKGKLNQVQERWVRLDDPSKVSCAYGFGFSFSLKYDGEVLFSRVFNSRELAFQCRAIMVQAREQSNAVYFRIITKSCGWDGALHTILVPENGFFYQK